MFSSQIVRTGAYQKILKICFDIFSSPGAGKGIGAGTAAAAGDVLKTCQQDIQMTSTIWKKISTNISKFGRDRVLSMKNGFFLYERKCVNTHSLLIYVEVVIVIKAIPSKFTFLTER